MSGQNDDSQGKAPASLLTSSQREYLRGERSVSRAAERSIQSRIRGRVLAGVTIDGPLLHEALANGELEAEKVIGPEVESHGAGTDDFARELRDTVAVVYQLARAANLNAKEVVRDGASRGESGYVETRAEAIHERYQENPDSITLGELDILVEAGLIDQQERNEAVEPTGGMVGNADLEEWLDDETPEE